MCQLIRGSGIAITFWSEGELQSERWCRVHCSYWSVQESQLQRQLSLFRVREKERGRREEKKRDGNRDKSRERIWKEVIHTQEKVKLEWKTTPASKGICFGRLTSYKHLISGRHLLGHHCPPPSRRGQFPLLEPPPTPTYLELAAARPTSEGRSEWEGGCGWDLDSSLL